VHALILSSHPLADRGAHKVDLLSGLVESDIDVTVLYAGTRLRDYTRELRRRSLSDVRRIALGRSSKSDGSGGGAQGLGGAARELGVRVVSFPTLRAPEALRFVGDLEPDVVLNLSALFVPPAFLEGAQDRTIGAHYAELPRLRGGDTVRWSILLDVPLLVSHQVLTNELDMGDVVARRAVEIERGDDIAAVRRKCQRASVDGHLEVAAAMGAGTLVRQPQDRAAGSTFFRMGSFLRARVDELLREGRYSHYGSGASR
jgi:hypothetical protein